MSREKKNRHKSKQDTLNEKTNKMFHFIHRIVHFYFVCLLAVVVAVFFLFLLCTFRAPIAALLYENEKVNIFLFAVEFCFGKYG